MKKFGFWIIPENDLHKEFEEIIAKYAKEYNFPIFPPHMAIHGAVSSTDEQVIEKIESTVVNIKPFELEVGDVEFSSTHFKCIFARIKTNANLLNTHLAIKNTFEIEEKHVFMPHVSLVYGDFDMSTREKIANEIKIKNKEFMAKKITIVRADSRDPKDWAIVKQVPFGL